MNANRLIKEITDFNDPGLDIYARLTENQLLNRHEPEKGMFIAESPKVIERALNAGYEPVSFLVETKHVTGEAAGILSRCPDTPVFTAGEEVLKNLTGFPMTRGALCAMKRKPLPSFSALCKDATRIVILDQVENPTNVGAIFRSAAALGMDAILLTPGCSNPLYRRAIRVSMGTVFQIPWTYFSGEMQETASYVDAVRALGYKSAAMALSKDSVNINHPALMAEEKLAVLLGSEGDGLPASTISTCDYTVCIPMAHGVDSLNVAAASAVAFWQLGHQRGDS